MPIDLMTPWGEELKNSGETPWQVYPRPQLVRESYVNLNGEWDFCVRPETAFPGEYDHKILVPFCPESQLSGLQFHPEDGKYLFYRRSFVLPEGFNRGRVLLHFGAVDQKADIYVNQKHLCHHLAKCGFAATWHSRQHYVFLGKENLLVNFFYFLCRYVFIYKFFCRNRRLCYEHIKSACGFYATLYRFTHNARTKRIINSVHYGA